MTMNIDHLSEQLGKLSCDNPAKVIGTIAIHGMWFIQYVQETDPELYRRARAFAIDCTKVNGVDVSDASGSIRFSPVDDPEPPEDYGNEL
jgi:hypothetical protein